MVLGRTSLPLLAMLVLILGASIYIISLVIEGNGGEGKFLYPEGAGRELLPVIPPQGEAPTETLALEVSFEIRPVARIFRDLDSVALPLSLSYAGKPFPCEVGSVAGSWCIPKTADGGRNLVHIQPQAGPGFYRILDLPAPGEGAVALPLWGPLALRGRVLDVDGEPLAGASVWGGTGDPAEASSWRSCEEDGAFELQLPFNGRGVPLVVRAEGFASTYRVLQVDASVREGVEVHLEKGISLRVQLAAMLDNPSAGRLFLRPAVGETRLRNYPFFLQTAGLSLDERGRCRIDDLPVDVDMGLMLRHPQVILPFYKGVRLGRKPEQFVMQAPRAAVIRGKVFDSEGRPIAGATLHSLKDMGVSVAGDSQALLPLGALIHGEAFAVSDASGAFSIAYSPRSARARLIRVSAPGYWGIELQLAAGEADLRRDFVLEPLSEVVGEPGLRFHLQAPGRRVIRQVGRSWHAWPLGEAFVRPFSEPALVDVLVRTRSRADGAEREQLFSRVMVTGSVDLEISAEK